MTVRTLALRFPHNLTVDLPDHGGVSEAAFIPFGAGAALLRGRKARP
ncbi:hypothetical protein [Streptosporangium sp. NPDC087985]